MDSEQVRSASPDDPGGDSMTSDSGRMQNAVNDTAVTQNQETVSGWCPEVSNPTAPDHAANRKLSMREICHSDMLDALLSSPDCELHVSQPIPRSGAAAKINLTSSFLAVSGNPMAQNKKPMNPCGSLNRHRCSGRIAKPKTLLQKRHQMERDIQRFAIGTMNHDHIQMLSMDLEEEEEPDTQDPAPGQGLTEKRSQELGLATVFIRLAKNDQILALGGSRLFPFPALEKSLVTIINLRDSQLNSQVTTTTFYPFEIDLEFATMAVDSVTLAPQCENTEKPNGLNLQFETVKLSSAARRAPPAPTPVPTVPDSDLILFQPSLPHDANSQTDSLFVDAEFKRQLQSRIKNQKELGLPSGYAACDLDDCIHSSSSDPSPLEPLELDAKEAAVHLSGDGSSNSTSSNDLSKQKDSTSDKRKNLQKVRRELKVLGMPFFEFDPGPAKRTEKCGKEHCRLLCICESLADQERGEDGTTIHSGAMVQFQTSALRGKATEEQKFVNTVVSTSGAEGELLMLASSTGRHKRERKVPLRYQDTDGSLSSSAAQSSSSHSPFKCAKYVPASRTNSSTPESASFQGTATKCMTAVGERHMSEEASLQSCTVAVDLVRIPAVKKWCLLHRIYDCQCDQLKRASDFVPNSSNPTSPKYHKEKGVIYDKKKSASLSATVQRATPEEQPERPHKSALDRSKTSARTRSFPGTSQNHHSRHTLSRLGYSPYDQGKTALMILNGTAVDDEPMPDVSADYIEEKNLGPECAGDEQEIDVIGIAEESSNVLRDTIKSEKEMAEPRRNAEIEDEVMCLDDLKHSKVIGITLNSPKTVGLQLSRAPEAKIRQKKKPIKIRHEMSPTKLLRLASKLQSKPEVSHILMDVVKMIKDSEENRQTKLAEIGQEKSRRYNAFKEFACLLLSMEDGTIDGEEKLTATFD